VKVPVGTVGPVGQCDRIF